MSVQEIALAVPMFAFYIVIFTAGIPILLSLGTGIGLIYCRRQVTDNH